METVVADEVILVQWNENSVVTVASNVGETTWI